jgi:hypothetical protein
MPKYKVWKEDGMTENYHISIITTDQKKIEWKSKEEPQITDSQNLIQICDPDTNRSTYIHQQYIVSIRIEDISEKENATQNAAIRTADSPTE